MNHFLIATILFIIGIYYLLWCFIDYVYNASAWSNNDVSNFNIFKYYFRRYY